MSFNPFKRNASRMSLAEDEGKPRLPPGQTLTEKLPVLHFGSVPSFDEASWDFVVCGLVEEPLKLTYREVLDMPAKQVTADFHCVTAWSRFDNHWEGISFQEIVRRVKPQEQAKWVSIICEEGWSTNLPLSVLLDDAVLLAYKHDGNFLTPEHGAPLRLVVPKKYGYKSAKWVRRIEFLDRDRPGFWERNGYHNDADPWREERYSWGLNL